MGEGLASRPPGTDPGPAAGAQEGFMSAATWKKGEAIVTTSMRTFPPFLMIKPGRLYFDVDSQDVGLKDTEVNIPESLDLEWLRAKGLQREERVLPADQGYLRPRPAAYFNSKQGRERAARRREAERPVPPDAAGTAKYELVGFIGLEPAHQPGRFHNVANIKTEAGQWVQTSSTSRGGVPQVAVASQPRGLSSHCLYKQAPRGASRRDPTLRRPGQGGAARESGKAGGSCAVM